jgi:hypothetical protein
MLTASSASAQPIDPIDPCNRTSPPDYCGVPSGSFSVSRNPSGLIVGGSAQDPDASGSLEVQFRVDSVYIGSAWTNGTSFSRTFTPRNGAQICGTVINQNEGRDVGIGCRAMPWGVDPVGYLDDVSPGPAGLHVAGWSIDPDTASPIAVHVYVDNAFSQGPAASVNRPDVGAAYPAYGSAHGYDLTIPAAPGPHTVCVYGINVGAGTVNTQLGCRTVTQGAPPATPGLTPTASQTSALIYVHVADNSNNETGFTIERATSSSGPWTVAHTTGAFSSTGFTWDDYGVVQGNQYCYRVTAQNAYGSSGAVSKCVNLPLPPLPKPTNISAANVTQTSLTLNWTDNATTETSYYINRPGANTVFLPGNPGTGPMSYNVTGLTAGTKYCFSIAAMESGRGYDPATYCVTTASAPPPQPVGIKTVQMWNCESHGRAGSAWYFDNSVGGWTRVGSVPSSWTSYGCGQSYTGPAASINLPNGHYVTLVEVIVDGTYCTADDPTYSACRHWQAGPVLGDSAGTTNPVVIG